MSLDDQKIEQIASQLEQAAPREQSKIEFDAYDNDRLKLLGNKAGYIRMAAEFLRVAIAPLAQNRETVSFDWKYLLTKHSSPIDEVSRTEDPEFVPASVETRWDKAKNVVLSLFAITLMLFVIACTVTAFFTLLGKLF